MFHRTPEHFSKACDLLDAYQRELLALLAQGDSFSDETSSALLTSKYLEHILDFSVSRQLKTFVRLTELGQALHGQSITTQVLSDIVSAAAESVPAMRSSSVFKIVSPLLSSLQSFLRKVTQSSGSRDLSGDEIKVLMVMIHGCRKQHKNTATQNINRAVIRAIERCEQFQLLKPTIKQSEGFDITPDNFQEHLHVFKKTVHALKTLDEETLRLNDQIAQGIEHIINHKEKIVEHVRTRYGVLYYLVGKDTLPLHTDHNRIEEPEAYYETLQRLLKQFFAIFCLARDKAELPAFCHRLSLGYCFEGRVTGLIEWACQLSEKKSFDELMQSYVAHYQAYQSVMCAKDAVASAKVKPASDFICRHHADTPCAVDLDYAPGGQVRRQGVEKYLRDILSFDRRSMSFLPRR